MSFSIRDAVADDFDAIVAFLDVHLRRDYFIPHRQLRDILTGRYHRSVLGVADGEILGIGIMSRSRRVLVNLLVRPCDRKRGIAHALLSKLRVEQVRVKMNVTDGDPTSWYTSRGYRLTDQRTGKPHIKIAVVDLDSPPSWTQTTPN